ncbi:MAG: exonuclease subunit SbcD [Myxococcales bacterium]|nr:exonuclease subunit SbcD [Myxococcales bacterium]
MRILHTSDWHLGISHGQTSRGPDQDRFLAWLTAQIDAQQIDTLIVAGDIFDSFQPPASALKRYFRFLGQLQATGVVQVVIVGGNHDSASRLDAPSEVLDGLGVHVVGGIGGSEASWDRCVIPLNNRAGDIAAVALAVPYVHEFRLGVRTTDADRGEVRAAFQRKFSALYSRLADLAQERYGDLPLVATGHLTLGSANKDDYPHEIHQVGHIDGLPPSLIDPRIQYAALGHIHASYPVDSARKAWYSGSPVAYSLREGRSERKVLQVSLAADPTGQPEVTPLVVPAARELLELRAEPDALLAQIAALRSPAPLPPLLFCRVQADSLPVDMSQRLHETLQQFAEDERPTLVELRLELLSPETEAADDVEHPSLKELQPREVFGVLCASQGQNDEAITAAFDTVATASPADLETLVAQIAGGAA